MKGLEKKLYRFTTEVVVRETDKWRGIFEKSLEKMKEEINESQLRKELGEIDIDNLDLEYIQELQEKYNSKEYNSLVNSYIVTNKWYREI